MVKEVIIKLYFCAIERGQRGFYPEFSCCIKYLTIQNSSIPSNIFHQLSSVHTKGLKAVTLMILSDHIQFPTTMKGLIYVFRPANVTLLILGCGFGVTLATYTEHYGFYKLLNTCKNDVIFHGKIRVVLISLFHSLGPLIQII